MVAEQWANIAGFNGAYQVSTHGRVRNSKTSRVLRTQMQNAGYLKVDMRKDGKPVTKTVHRLVAEAFVPNPHGKPEVNHKNTDKTCNFATNLEWATRVENLDHARSYGAWESAQWCTSTTGVRGVTPHADGGFIARTTINKQRVYLGYFRTVEEASEAIQAAKGKS